MKRIKTQNGETFAHLLGKGTIEIKRQGQRFIVTGSDFQIIGTEPTQTRKMVIAVENGRLIEDDIILDDDGLGEEKEKALEKAKEEAEKQAETLETEQKALENATNSQENTEEQQQDE